MPRSPKKKTLTISAFLGEDRDAARDSRRRFFPQFVGMDAAPTNESGVGMAVSPDGYEMLTHVPMQDNNTGGATGDGAGKMSLKAYSFKGVRGNVFATVRNGDGTNSASVEYGREGEIPHVYQEIWDGKAGVPLFSTNFETPLDEDVTDWLLGVTSAEVSTRALWRASDTTDTPSFAAVSGTSSDNGQIVICKDRGGNFWVAKVVESAGNPTGLEIKYYDTDNTLSDNQQTISFTSANRIYGIPLIDEEGCYVIISSSTTASLYKFTKTRVISVGSISGATFGTSSGEYGFCQGLSYTTDGNLLTLATKVGSPDTYHAIKFSPTTGEIATNYPSALSVNADEAEFVAGCLQMGADGKHYAFLFVSSDPAHGIYSFSATADGVSGVTEVVSTDEYWTNPAFFNFIRNNNGDIFMIAAETETSFVSGRFYDASEDAVGDEIDPSSDAIGMDWGEQNDEVTGVFRTKNGRYVVTGQDLDYEEATITTQTSYMLVNNTNESPILINNTSGAQAEVVDVDFNDASVVFGQDADGNIFFGIAESDGEGGDQLDVYYVSSSGTVSSVIGTIPDHFAVFCVGKIDGSEGMLVLQSQNSDGDGVLYNVTTSAVTELGRLSDSIDIGLSTEAYRYPQGLAWTVDGNLLCAIQKNDTTDTIAFVKFSASDATVASGFPDDTEITDDGNHGLSTYVSGSLQLGADGYHYCYIPKENDGYLGKFEVGASVGTITELVNITTLIDVPGGLPEETDTFPFAVASNGDIVFVTDRDNSAADMGAWFYDASATTTTEIDFASTGFVPSISRYPSVWAYERGGETKWRITGREGTSGYGAIQSVSNDGTADADGEVVLNSSFGASYAIGQRNVTCNCDMEGYLLEQAVTAQTPIYHAGVAIFDEDGEFVAKYSASSAEDLLFAPNYLHDQLHDIEGVLMGELVRVIEEEGEIEPEPPQDEGTTVTYLEPSDGASQVSIRGKSVVFSPKNRPLVIENDGDVFATYNAGIMPALGTPTVDFSRGVATKTGRVAVVTNAASANAKTHSQAGDGSAATFFDIVFQTKTTVSDIYSISILPQSVCYRYDGENLDVLSTMQNYIPGELEGGKGGTWEYSKVSPLVLEPTEANEPDNSTPGAYDSESTANGAILIGAAVVSGDASSDPFTSGQQFTVRVYTHAYRSRNLKAPYRFAIAVLFPDEFVEISSVSAGDLGNVTNATYDEDDGTFQITYPGGSQSSYPIPRPAVTSGTTPGRIVRATETSEDRIAFFRYDTKRERFSPLGLEFDTPLGAKLDITNLLGDDATDEYDAIGVARFTATVGDYKWLYTINAAAQEKVHIGYESDDLLNRKPSVPFSQYEPFPACSTGLSVDIGGSERLIGARQVGFDPFADGTRVANLTPTARMTSKGILTFASSASVWQYRDGTYLVVGIDADGNEVSRGFIHDSGSGDASDSNSTTGIDSIALTGNQIQVCTDFDRSEAAIFDGDPEGDWENQRWEIRRQVCARVTQGSDRGTLYYNYYGGSYTTLATTNYLADPGDGEPIISSTASSVTLCVSQPFYSRAVIGASYRISDGSDADTILYQGTVTSKGYESSVYSITFSNDSGYSTPTDGTFSSTSQGSLTFATVNLSNASLANHSPYTDPVIASSSTEAELGISSSGYSNLVVGSIYQIIDKSDDTTVLYRGTLKELRQYKVDGQQIYSAVFTTSSGYTAPEEGTLVPGTGGTADYFQVANNVIDIIAEGPALAEIASQYWTQQEVVINGIGSGTIRKTATSGGTYDGSLDTSKTLGSELVLVAEWEGESGTGFLSVRPTSKVVFIGRGSANDWDSAGKGFTLRLNSNTPIRALATVKGYPCAIAEANDVFVLRWPSGIPDPVTTEEAILFETSLYTSISPFRYAGSCVSTYGTWVGSSQDAGWIGAEGPWMFDGVSAILLIQDAQREKWGEYYANGLFNARAVVDPIHVFSPVVRVCGIATSQNGNKSEQLVLTIPRGNWLNFSGQANIDAAYTVLMKNGQNRVCFGGNSRLWLYGVPARRGQNTTADLYGLPRVPGGIQSGTATLPSAVTTLSSATVTSAANGSLYDYTFTVNAQYALAEVVGDIYEVVNSSGESIIGSLKSKTATTRVITSSTAPGSAPSFASGNSVYRVAIEDSTNGFSGVGKGWFWRGSKIRVARVDDQNSVVYGTIVRADIESNQIIIDPDSTWPRSSERTYRYVIGPRKFTIQLQDFGPSVGFEFFEMTGYQIDVEDQSSFDWPLSVSITDSGLSSNISATLDERNLSRTDMQYQWQWQELVAAESYNTTVTVAGVFPPDCHAYLKAIRLKMQEIPG